MYRIKYVWEDLTTSGESIGTHCHVTVLTTPLRQGAQFVEVWVEGFAFTELARQQEELSQQREEIEKQRKVFSKRKPSLSTGGSKGRVKNDDGFTRPTTPR